MNGALSEKKREDFLASYTAIRKFEMATDPDHIAQTTALLGRPPTSYEAYVRSVDLPDKISDREPNRSALRTQSQHLADNGAAH
ncbi:MAG: hypothetical protein ABW133_15565 [Polyangiaceae bacterium]